MSSVEGEWEEREKEGEVITAQFRLPPPPDYFPKIRSVAWTHKWGGRARVVGGRILVGWFWSEMLRRASVFHPHPGENNNCGGGSSGGGNET